MKIQSFILKGKLIPAFFNNYFDDGLKAWKANMGLQFVFKEYKAVPCLC